MKVRIVELLRDIFDFKISFYRSRMGHNWPIIYSLICRKNEIISPADQVWSLTSKHNCIKYRQWISCSTKSSSKPLMEWSFVICFRHELQTVQANVQNVRHIFPGTQLALISIIMFLHFGSTHSMHYFLWILIKSNGKLSILYVEIGLILFIKASMPLSSFMNFWLILIKREKWTERSRSIQYNRYTKWNKETTIIIINWFFKWCKFTTL